jgi:hypothetical protein
MKSLIKLNIIIILFSLTACHQEKSVEKNHFLNTGTNHLVLRSILNFPDGVRRKNSTFNKNEIDKKFYDLFISPVFLDRLKEVIEIKDPSKNINFLLQGISTKKDAYVLFSMFSYEFREGNNIKLDENWANFLKILSIEKHLPKLAIRFTQITEFLKNNISLKHPIYLYFYNQFKAIKEQINSYNKKSIGDLKIDQKFLEFLRKALNLIERLLELDEIFYNKLQNRIIEKEQERENLLDLQEDIKLFEEFFNKHFNYNW